MDILKTRARTHPHTTPPFPHTFRNIYFITLHYITTHTRTHTRTHTPFSGNPPTGYVPGMVMEATATASLLQSVLHS